MRHWRGFAFKALTVVGAISVTGGELTGCAPSSSTASRPLQVTDPTQSASLDHANAARSRDGDASVANQADAGSANQADSRQARSTQQSDPRQLTDAGLPFKRVLEHPVSDLAIDKPPHVAALAEDSAWVHDERGWRALPLPNAAKPASAEQVAVFFGRDYRVRLLGSQPSEPTHSLYQRWLPGGFRAAPDELGLLGAASEPPLVGVLGTEDPEVVCRPGHRCIIKRVSGWTVLDAPVDLKLAAIDDNNAWAIAGTELLQLDGDKWAVRSNNAPWRDPTAMAVEAGAVWVTEFAADRLHRFSASEWTTIPSPLKGPRDIWVSPDGSVWLACEGGLARRTASHWERVRSVPGEVHAVLGRVHANGDTQIWAAGTQGVYVFPLSPQTPAD